MFTLPYFQFTYINIGPVHVQVWGLFVALGILTGYYIVRRSMRGAPPAYVNDIENLIFWVIIAAFIGARVGHVILYNPAWYLAHPGEVFKIWHGGLSSFGGFFGASIPLLLFYRRHAGSFASTLDLFARAFPWAWGIGRLGCFMIHDHPGVEWPGCFLGIRYPDGKVRADLGLYDALLAFVIGLIVHIFGKKTFFKPKGSVTVFVIISYLIPRFFFDFMRANDVVGADARYAGLTPAQYASVLMIIVVLTIWGRFR